MKTENGSEKGEMKDESYWTEEIKICLECDTRVREHYSANLIIKNP